MRPQQNSLGAPVPPSFWNWFGGSKIVDSQGRPFVVFHGTKKQFSHFSTSKHGTNTTHKGNIAFSFAADPDHASQYAGVYATADATGARIIPAYVKMERPFYMTRKGTRERDLILKELEKQYPESLHEARMLREYGASIPDNEATAHALLSVLKDHGYDGYIYDPHGDGFTHDNRLLEVGVLNSRQIKSTLGSRTFTDTDAMTNPPSQHWPVMSYSAAHRYEPLAKAKGVSAVARSGRGFMRAFEKAGSWAKLDQWWKDRRNNFVSRHMAQVRTRGEQLWKNGKPSRRALALIMWAYMPPGKNPTTRKNPLYRTGRFLLKSHTTPDDRSNKVRYFRSGEQAPWRRSRGFGPEWNDILQLSRKQARAIAAQRNPRTKIIHVKHKGRTLRVRLDR